MDCDLITEKFFDGDNLHGVTLIRVRDGIVVEISDVEALPDIALVTPGLVDLQMNGFAAHDVASAHYEDFLALDEELACVGTTSWLATVITAPLDRLTKTLARLDGFVQSPTNGCFGIHCEGPFLGDAPGAHRPDWIIPSNLEWISTLPASLRVMTLAPENSGSNRAISSLCERGIRVSLGHTRASYKQFAASVDAGASMVTHLFNGMSGVHHRDEGVALWSLLEPRLTAGLIADGVHVSPNSIRLAFAARNDGLYLVSDSIAWNGKWATAANVSVVDNAPRLPNGTLAGSATPLSECVHHCIQECELEMATVLRAATSIPADVVGEPAIGRIAVGQPADIVEWTADVHVSHVHRRLVFQRG